MDALAALYKHMLLLPLWFAVGVVWSLDFLLLELRVLALRPGISKKNPKCVHLVLYHYTLLWNSLI